MPGSSKLTTSSRFRSYVVIAGAVWNVFHSRCGLSVLLRRSQPSALARCVSRPFVPSFTNKRGGVCHSRQSPRPASRGRKHCSQRYSLHRNRNANDNLRKIATWASSDRSSRLRYWNPGERKAERLSPFLRAGLCPQRNNCFGIGLTITGRAVTLHAGKVVMFKRQGPALVLRWPLRRIETVMPTARIGS